MSNFSFHPTACLISVQSIDLTRLQSMPNLSASSSTSPHTNPSIEYSSREVCPQPLLLQHLLRAHSVFLLHHGSSLADIYTRLTRQRFCGALERFWNKFIREWDVLLHGNPAVDIYNGLKLAAGGELGIGVGEEDWGSGEREVLEGFIERTEGLVDIVVSRFGNVPGGLEEIATVPSQAIAANDEKDPNPWLASTTHPRSSDGVIFSGIGAMGRPSLRSISVWMEWLYKDGDNAYGVSDNPLSARRKKRKKHADQDKAIIRDTRDEFARQTQQPRVHAMARNSISTPQSIEKVGIPPPIVVATESSPALSAYVDKPSSKSQEGERQRSTSSRKQNDPLLDTETLMKYMTFGVYGSSWGIPAGRPAVHRHTYDPQQKDSSADEAPEGKRVAKLREVDPIPIISPRKELSRTTTAEAIQGAFLVGLHADLEAEEMTEDEANGIGTGTDQELGLGNSDWNRSISVRTLYVERNAMEISGSTQASLHGKSMS